MRRRHPAPRLIVAAAWAGNRTTALVSQRVAPKVLRLSEAALLPAERGFFHLLSGDDCDVLIDGGWGCGTLDAVRPDPAKPLIAIATHSHVDHIGLLHQAARRFGHAAEAGVFADPDPHATLAWPWLDGLAVFDDGGMIEAGTFAQKACPLTDIVDDDGPELQFGGFDFQVIHTPGHSQGSLCILERRAGLLFCGDVVHDGAILDAIAGADRRALQQSHDRIRELDFNHALAGHGAVLTRDQTMACIERHWRGNRR
jgi:glyoxylase-like metal-dependent hydrolase (beta-lactamase superfamily II)